MNANLSLVGRSIHTTVRVGYTVQVITGIRGRLKGLVVGGIPVSSGNRPGSTYVLVTGEWPVATNCETKGAGSSRTN